MNELDLTLTGDFDATELTVTAVSERGKELLSSMFGVGAVSFTLPKSRGFDFIEFAERKGLKVQ